MLFSAAPLAGEVKATRSRHAQTAVVLVTADTAGSQSPFVGWGIPCQAPSLEYLQAISVGTPSGIALVRPVRRRRSRRGRAVARDRAAGLEDNPSRIAEHGIVPRGTRLACSLARAGLDRYSLRELR